MLKPIDKLFDDPIIRMLVSGLRGYVALENNLDENRRPVGATLSRSFGHSRVPTYFLNDGDEYHSRIKAWNDNEAIEIANRRLAKRRKV